MFRRILLPVDLDATAENARLAKAASEMVTAFGAELHILTVVPTYGTSLVGSFFPEDFERNAQKAGAAQLAALVESAFAPGVKAVPHVAVGSVYDKVLEAANRLDCDVILMGAHRPELRDYLLGPNAARVVRHARQSVVVLRE